MAFTKKVVTLRHYSGKMPEWSIGPHSKCGERATVLNGQLFPGFESLSFRIVTPPQGNDPQQAGVSYGKARQNQRLDFPTSPSPLAAKSGVHF